MTSTTDIATGTDWVAGTWTIDPSHSEVGFTVRHLVSKVRGQFETFEGNFASYEENKIERLGVEAARPHRVTHRRLTRD